MKLSNRNKSKTLVTAYQILCIAIVLNLIPRLGNAKEVMSVNPLFYETNVVVEKMIEGEWYDESNSSIVISRIGDNFYNIEMLENDILIKAEVVITKIAGRMIIDISLIPTFDPLYEILTPIILPHTFYSISVNEEMLSLAPLSTDWFTELVREEKAPQHSWSKKGLLLTGTTKELNELFNDHCNDSGFWNAPSFYNRRETSTKVAPPLIEYVNKTSQKFDSTEALDNNSAVSYTKCNASFPYKDGWLGGDGAISIPISDTKILWLFSDTFVGQKSQLTRKDSRIVANTIAVSTCNEEKEWNMDYYWGDMYSENPKAFFESNTDRYKYWLRTVFDYEGDLYVAMTKVEHKINSVSDELFTFNHIGSSIARISNFRTVSPEDWKIELIPWSQIIESENWKFIGKHEDHLYIFYGHTDTSTFLIRLPLSSVDRPKEQMEYLVTDMSWQSGFDTLQSKRVMKYMNFGGGSLKYHEDLKLWVAIFGPRFLDNKILMITAPDIVGPWSEEIEIYTVPESTPGNAKYDKTYFCYLAKEHIQFYDKNKKELLITYDCNSSDFGKLLSNMEIYSPRVISIPIQ